MARDTSEKPEATESGAGRLLTRALILALGILGLLVGGVAAVSVFSDDSEPLPFRYEGFD